MNRVEYFTLYFVYLFVAKFVLVYVYSLGASVAAIRTTKTLRLDFLQCLLRQDISFFDSKEGGSPSVKVTTNGYYTQQATLILVGIMLTFIETTSTTE
jgi:ATP-binding cassette subfamily B (MDR/TAP) protein 1